MKTTCPHEVTLTLGYAFDGLFRVGIDNDRSRYLRVRATGQALGEATREGQVVCSLGPVDVLVAAYEDRFVLTVTPCRAARAVAKAA